MRGLAIQSASKAALAALILAFVCGVVGCNSNTSTNSEAAARLNGSGSTFVYPLMVQWRSAYEKREDGCKIAYRSLGSGGGIQQITENKVDFACTDAPMTDAEIVKAKAVGGDIIHVPLVLGAVVAAYNLPEVKEPLRFSGPVLADIYLGKIKNWNDDTLAKLNPGVKLPDRPILPVHRRDDSGTTYIFTDYVSKLSPQWQNDVGTGHEVKWPTGQAKVGNEGVAQYIKDHAGTIGYVELIYALRKDLAFGLMQNKEGEFIKANLQSITTAAGNALATIPDDLRFSITDAPGKGAYPICGTTWAVIRVNQPAGKGQDLVKFLQWSVDEGQGYCEALFYARLPEALAERAKEKLAKVQVAK